MCFIRLTTLSAFKTFPVKYALILEAALKFSFKCRANKTLRQLYILNNNTNIYTGYVTFRQLNVLRCDMVLHIKGGKQIKGVCEKGAEEIIWT